MEDISDVHPNMRAEVHLTAYKQRLVPIIHGDVIQVSADRLTDQKTNNPCYTAFGSTRVVPLLHVAFAACGWNSGS